MPLLKDPLCSFAFSLLALKPRSACPQHHSACSAWIVRQTACRMLLANQGRRSVLAWHHGGQHQVGHTKGSTSFVWQTQLVTPLSPHQQTVKHGGRMNQLHWVDISGHCFQKNVSEDTNKGFHEQ